MKKLIEVTEMSYTLPHGRQILEKMNFDLSEGQFLGVLGRNGVGKTTLMDLLLGLRPVTSGLIRILDEDPISIERKKLSEICFLSQDNTLKSNISIKDFLIFYASFYENYSSNEEKNLLDFFSLNPEVKIGSLSTGQQKKVQIVGALSSLPKLLLIDEITAVLDPETRNHFFSSIERHKKERGMAIILATNIAEDLIVRADQVLFIDNCRSQLKMPSEILNLFNIEKSA